MAPWYAEGAIQDPGLRADASIFNMKSAAKCSPKSRVREKRSKAKQNKVTRKEALRIPGCVREVSLSVRQLVHGISRSCHRSLAPRRGAVQPDGTSKANQRQNKPKAETGVPPPPTLCPALLMAPHRWVHIHTAILALDLHALMLTIMSGHELRRNAPRKDAQRVVER